MEIVGAEKSFIKKPYLRAAFGMIMKAMIAVFVFIGGLSGYLIQSGSIFAEILQIKYVVLTLVISFLAALIIQFATTNSILNDFLRKVNR